MASSTVTVIKGHIYRAKKPRFIGWADLYNDRQVVYVGATQVQYDSSTVKTGYKYPTVAREVFEKWAGKDVTDGYPKDDWAARPQ